MREHEIGAVVQELLEKDLDTMSYYFDVYEDDLAEHRDELHQQIIETVLHSKSHSKSKSVFMLGGAPANGKSSFLKSGKITYPPLALKIDPDEIKEMLPEYKWMTRNNEPLAAEKVHEESSFIGKEIRRIAIDDEYDILLDV